MFRNHHLDRVREIFADQFESSDSGLVYRKSMKGAPIPISIAERDDFITIFDRHLRYAIWSIIILMLLGVCLLVAFIPEDEISFFNALMYIGIALILCFFMAIYYWAWNGPARALERRAAVGGARSRTEMKQLMLAKTSYGQLMAAAAGYFVMLWGVSERHDIFHGWGLLWLALGLIILVLSAIQAIRKWRFDRAGK
jgi:peptidoglycan/LPS O-acetylase OafA/YrhL